MAEYNPSAVAKQAKQVINEPVPVRLLTVSSPPIVAVIAPETH